MTIVAKNQSQEVPVQLTQDLTVDLAPHSATGSEVHLRLLSLLEQNPAWTQRQLADALGVSLGKTNYCLRALRDKGLVKWGNFSQNPKKLQHEIARLRAELDNSNPEPVTVSVSLVESFRLMRALQ